MLLNGWTDRSPGSAAGRPLQLTAHPSSVLSRCKPSWVVYTMVQETAGGGYQMQEITAIKPEWLFELAPHMYKQKPGPGPGVPL